MLHRTLMPKLRTYLLESDPFSFQTNMELIFLSLSKDFYYYLLKDVGTEAYLLKVRSKEHAADGLLDREHRVLSALQACPYTPDVYYFEEAGADFSHDFLIMEYLRGDSLEYARDYLKVAMILGSVHRYKEAVELPRRIDPLDYSLQQAKKNLENALPSGAFHMDHLYFFEGFMEWAEAHLEQRRHLFTEEHLAINHRNLDTHDFVIDHRFLLYEWQDAFIADQSLDVTKFLAKTTSLWDSRFVMRAIDREDFYYLHEKALGVEKSNLRERVHAYMPYYLLEQFSGFAKYFYDHGKPDAQGVDERLMKKIQTFLEVDFMRDILKEYL